VFPAPDEHAQKIQSRKRRRPRRPAKVRHPADKKRQAEAGRLRRRRKAPEIEHQPAGRANQKRVLRVLHQQAHRRCADHGQRNAERQLHAHKSRKQTHRRSVWPQPGSLLRRAERPDAHDQQRQPQRKQQRRPDAAVGLQNENQPQQCVDPARRRRDKAAPLRGQQIAEQAAARQHQKTRRDRLQRSR